MRKRRAYVRARGPTVQRGEAQKRAQLWSACGFSLLLHLGVKSLRRKAKISLKTFEELGVSEAIRRAISEMGYEQPMPVQEEVIPYLLGVGNDVIALAQTGTGKTAAFGLPLTQKMQTQATSLTIQSVLAKKNLFSKKSLLLKKQIKMTQFLKTL